ncbi:unnamed protein product [Lasius platythorax]|uniref:Alpha-mannosidase n=1 Tax=Lasius platythorax TaxID=488582 RepID=A0AAV2NXL1_9HYME
MLWHEFPLLLLLPLLFAQHFVNAARIPRVTSELPVIENCGYKACHAVDPTKLNIHMVSHTHDDVGWLKTVDQYYFGSRSTIQKAGVQYILDSVIKALLADPNRRFIYVETSFFWKWWLRQNEKVQADVKMLINEGRLEFIGGAWSMNDEACTHYHSLVDQFTWGFRRLNDTFGSCARPHIGWQIDPFGHSREQASLFAQMGFDGMLFGRIDYQDKIKRLSEQSMEFIWESSPSLGKRANLFTTAMYNTYSPPPGFCFDVLCADDPMIDDPDSPDYNIDKKIDDFLRYAVVQANYYRTNHIILTMGGDFTYQHAEMYFTNLDKLIRYTNQRNGSSVNVIYSTPSCYLKALNDKKLQWPTKNDDFFPYASDPHSYWTGYFSSRPTSKYFERMGNNLLQTSKQLVTLMNLKNHTEHLDHFREAMGVMQHHDAVTGTEKQLVANDYARLLYKSMSHAGEMISEAVGKWSGLANEPSVKVFTCLELNISSCAFSEQNDMFIVVVYNPLSRPVSTYVRLPVKENSYSVLSLNDDGLFQDMQMVPIPERVQKIPGRLSNAVNEVVFRVENIPALGLKFYAVAKQSREEIIEQSEPAEFISSELYNISINDDGNLIVRWNKQNNMNLVQSFHFYEGAEGNNEISANRSSGAYIFRPKETSARNFEYTGSYKIYKGPIVEELHHTINEWVSQVVRIYPEEEHIEFDWLVGPIPAKDKVGKEIVTRYSSNLKTDNVFYTDSNGREMLKRVRNYRPTWDLELKEPISGNYYPVTSKISIKDEEKQLKLSVLNDRAQGGSSLQDGAVELMIHRRLLKDDAFGVNEALNETAFGEGLVARGTHYLFGGKVKNVDKFVLKEKELALKLALHPWILGVSLDWNSIDNMRDKFQTFFSGLMKALPPNVHILTLEPWKDDTILLRLEHIFEVGETQYMSQPVEVNIQDLFSTFSIQSIQETTLGANQLLSENNRMKWEPETNNITLNKEENIQPVEIHDNIINVLLKPMEIRTFILKVDPRSL